MNSITLHWCTDNRDLSRVCYDDRLISMIGIERDQLPELKRAVDILGVIKPEVADQLGLSKSVQVVMGTPDVQSAALGSGAVEDYAAHFYIGTSSWLTCHVPYKKTDLLHNMASLPSAIPDRYLVGNSQEIAGAAFDFLINNILFCDDELETGKKPDNVHQILCKIASRVPAGSDKLIFTPWLYGERTPVEDATLRGGFFQPVTENHTRALCPGGARGRSL